MFWTDQRLCYCDSLLSASISDHMFMFSYPRSTRSEPNQVVPYPCRFSVTKCASSATTTSSGQQIRSTTWTSSIFFSKLPKVDTKPSPRASCFWKWHTLSQLVLVFPSSSPWKDRPSDHWNSMVNSTSGTCSGDPALWSSRDTSSQGISLCWFSTENMGLVSKFMLLDNSRSCLLNWWVKKELRLQKLRRRWNLTKPEVAALWGHSLWIHGVKRLDWFN